jgi:hypothetical protein
MDSMLVGSGRAIVGGAAHPQVILSHDPGPGPARSDTPNRRPGGSSTQTRQVVF